MPCRKLQHNNHAFTSFHPHEQEGLCVFSRRNMLKASFAGLGGLSLPALQQLRVEASQAGQPMRQKSVILLWMTGGPSHIDTWDPKPDRPLNNRGPFSTIETKVPGIFICEHLPKQAAMMDRFTLIRSVDSERSSHQPNQVMQTGHRDAAPRTKKNGHMFPAIGSIVARHRDNGRLDIPPYVTFHKHHSHVAWGGYLGKKYDPFNGNLAAELPQYDLLGKPLNKTSRADLFNLAAGLNHERLLDRHTLRQDLDNLQRGLDLNGSQMALDAYQQRAYDLVLGGKAKQAFDLSLEPESVRERYGDHLWCQQALLARRLVESGVSYVTLDLSHHTASGTWDNHGIPGGVYGGITKGLKPLLPLFDHLLTTLVSDLEERGLLDDVLVIAMGEFGRTPNMGTQNSQDGRNHWPSVMSMCLAGGGFRHGQVIGASSEDGGEIAERPVTPGDLAATIYRHMDVPLDTQYLDHQGRPRFAVQENGQPLSELV
ncbi:DUF1501 domain-containing protein [Rubinisphaera italica]|uniref:DUF1501 domain-containing protein n=1 Tax=Rubinisphaera italica TaxID=2527969 RepID=A0A5C5XBY1_9PLAN|nr:DUF1501 domain-containing protein [Rubinisphaera italica]TWT60510.1 hypothetical protein Pan54_12240 [Rubinisphaera italica]